MKKLGELIYIILFIPVALLMAVLTYLDFYKSDHLLPRRKF